MGEDAVAQLNRIIHERRSTKPRRFNGIAIDDEVIWQLLNNANWAPTHGMTQPWRFFVYTRGGLHRLARFQAALYKRCTPKAEFSLDKYERMRTNLLKSSHVVVLAMVRKLEAIPEVEEIEAVACSVQNMMLTAAAYGICSFWGSGGVTYTDDLKEFLGLGPADRCLGYLYLGYSDDPPTEGKRSPIEDKVTWIARDTED